MTSLPARPSAVRVLLVEDNPDHAQLTGRLLSDRCWYVESVGTLGEALERLAFGDVDVVLLDLHLPDAAGLASVERLCGAHPGVPVVVLTNLSGDEIGTAAVRQGAQDFLVKTELDGPTLSRSLRYAIERARAERSAAWLAAIVESSEDAVVGVSPTGLVTSWNAAAERLLGYRADEMVGAPVARIDPGDAAPTTPALVGHALLGERQPALETSRRARDGSLVDVSLRASSITSAQGRVMGASLILRDARAARASARERERLIAELQESLASVRTLRGLLPMCAACKKVRDDRGYWKQIEVYLRDQTDAEPSHGICPDCARRLYPDHFRAMYPDEA